MILDAVWGGRTKDPPLRPGSDEPPKTSNYLRRARADLRSLSLSRYSGDTLMSVNSESPRYKQDGTGRSVMVTQ